MLIYLNGTFPKNDVLFGIANKETFRVTNIITWSIIRTSPVILLFGT